MAIYISLRLLAEIYFKPTTWLKPCSDYGSSVLLQYSGVISISLFIADGIDNNR